ncbi:MAG: SurA N-terminal domain-containing protein [Gammaproteobacteria bacterium]|nr:SurA N-terminal domain-containing protein [Gammaproteobacteria bacterium]
MLQSINDKAKGILGWIIIAFISVPFALWGIQEYIGGAPERFAAKVDDTEISLRDFDQALTQYRQRLESSLQGQLPTGEAFNKRIKEQVLDQLITQRVLEIMVQNSGYRISNASLAKNIQAMEAFQRDGKFVPGSYKAIVNSQGMSVAEFEHLFRRDLAVQQLQNGVTRSTIVGNRSLQLIDRLQQQTRDVSYLLYEQDKYNSEISLTDDEIQQYFAENQNRYMHPEQVSISYVELKADDLDIDIPVDEEELRRQYDEYVAGLGDSEQRKARHILIQLNDSADTATQAEKKSQAEDILNKLHAGESFENLAKSFSEDPGSAKQGGDLGWISKGMMVPAFENALFALKKGEISAIVKSGFGYHIIKMDDLKSSIPESYETRKAGLITDLQKQAIDNQFYERSELMATLAYENDETLQPVADALNIKIKHTQSFTRLSGQGVAANDAVRKAAFTTTVLKGGRNSEVIELGENHILVLRIDEHKPSKAKTLDEVKPQVTASLIASKARAKAQAAGLQALVDLQQGKSIEALAQDPHVELIKLGSIKRDKKDADQTVVQVAFQMAKPESNKPSLKTVDMSSGTAVIVLNAVDEKEDVSEPSVMAVIGKQLENSLSNQEMIATLDYLKSQADITKANDLF